MPPQIYRVRICIPTRPTGDTYGHSSLRSTDAAPFRIKRNVWGNNMSVANSNNGDQNMDCALEKWQVELEA